MTWFPTHRRHRAAIVTGIVALGVAVLVATSSAAARPNAGGDQYRPGYGWGDPNHNHTGPPGLTRAGGERAAPLRARPTRDGRAAIVSTRIVLDEQARLFIGVLDPNGQRLLLNQEGSTVGTGVSGPPAKTIVYQVLVPRVLPLKLRIPLALLDRGETYRIRIVAQDPSARRSVLLIPFRR